MKTGIIVYSHTGNTLKAAQQLLDSMIKKGRDAELVQIKAGNEKPQMSPSRVKLNYCPSVEDFDHLVFAAPVWGFSMCGVMRAYLDELPSLKGKKISLFVTYAFPLPWLGADRALGQMKRSCEHKGGKVGATASVSWSQKRHQSDLEKMAETLA